MQNHEIELSVGDVLQIGEHLVTVIDIDGPDVSFRVDKVPTEEFSVEETQRAARLSK